ncbi:hypothetical protein KY362_01355 [Candidatus Woesearchaeota archaeon]|nr:hypothetical protein [Candidatus Woesearchaeota archaeon]
MEKTRPDRTGNADMRIIHIAFFMIFLTVMLPVCSADAFAAAINPPIVVYGEHGVHGFRALNDITVVEVSATVPEDLELDGSQVKILSDPTQGFDCTLVDESAALFNCILEYPEQVANMREPVPRFSVQIFNDDGREISAPVQGSVTIDANPPTIHSVNYMPMETGTVEARYTVEETACDDPRCSGKCAGIGSIVFSVAGLTVGQETDFDLTSCRQTGIVELSGLTTSGQVLEKQVCIDVTDAFDQTASQCGTVMLDTRPPLVDSIGLYDSNENELTYLNGRPVDDIDLVIIITEDSGLFHPDGTENFIQVNASVLSDRDVDQAAYSNFKMACTHQDGTRYRCSQDGIHIIVGDDRSLGIGIKAKDRYENELDTQSTIPMGFDDTQPIATRIYSSWENDQGYHFVREGQNTTIYMDVTETGSGMTNRYAFMDFNAFGPQESVVEGSYTRLFASACEPGWKCSWEAIGTNTPSGTTLGLRLDAGSKDDAGNAFASPSPMGQFYADIDPPEISEDLQELSVIISTGPLHAPLENVLIGGDTLEIHMFVKDHSGIKSAYANLSEILDEPEWTEPLEGVCTEITAHDPGEEQRLYDCVWVTDEIRRGYLRDMSIPFTFEDYAGHTLEYALVALEILGVGGDTDGWEAEAVEKMPDIGIDRMTWALAPSRMYYKVEFYKPSNVIDVIGMSFDPRFCTGLDFVNQDTETAEFMVGFAGYLNFEDYTPTDIAVIELNPAAVPEYEEVDEYGNEIAVTEIYVDCPVIIQSIVLDGTGAALGLPELVNVSFEIPVYNNPLGQNIGNILDTIEDEEDYLENGFWKFTYYGDMILKYAQEACRFIELWMQLTGMFATLRDIFQGAASQPAGGPAFQAAAGVAGHAETRAADTSDTLFDQIYYFCGLFISCHMSRDQRRQMQRNCANPGDATEGQGWCRAKVFMARMHQWWGEYASLDFLQRNPQFGMGLGSTGTG